MNYGITEEDIYKQLGGNYKTGIIILGVVAVLVGAGGGFCAKNLGFLNVVTIIFLLLFVAALVFFVILIIKMSTVKTHPDILRQGGAAKLAARINNGMQNPVYTAYSLDGSNSLVTLITEDFIVAGNTYTNLMNLKSIRNVTTTYIPERIVIYINNPVMTAASLAGDAIGKAYWGSKGLNENTKFDYLEITDLYGNKGLYGVQHKDMEYVLSYLLANAPKMKLDPVPRQM